MLVDSLPVRRKSSMRTHTKAMRKNTLAIWKNSLVLRTFTSAMRYNKELQYVEIQLGNKEDQLSY